MKPEQSKSQRNTPRQPTCLGIHRTCLPRVQAFGPSLAFGMLHHDFQTAYGQRFVSATTTHARASFVFAPHSTRFPGSASLCFYAGLLSSLLHSVSCYDISSASPFGRLYSLLRWLLGVSRFSHTDMFPDTNSGMTATPNQALQRTRSAVTLAASSRRLSPAMQPARQLRESLSLGSLGQFHNT